MIRVSVALAVPGRQEVVVLEVAEGSTVADALSHPELAGHLAQIDLAHAKVGVWSRPCGRDLPLRDGDRIEIYRPLRVDPKEARRQRAQVRPSPRSRSGR